VIRRFDDPADWRHDDGAPDAVLRGLPLTAGRVTGSAWVLDEPATARPAGFDRRTTVLVARSIDAGWITTLESVAAVVVEIGGDLSHGSILVRELGLPAVTNVAGATRRLTTGQEITVDAGAGTVRPAPDTSPIP
jgi:pyruvate,water dikinase